MDGKQWYLCDPERNPGCSKRNCWLWGNWGCCMITSRPESARLDGDGRLLRVRILREGGGFRILPEAGQTDTE